MGEFKMVATVEEMNKKAEQMKKIFDKYQQGNWKGKQTAITCFMVEAKEIKAAFEWFHGTEATIEETTVYARHPEGLVNFEVAAYRVSSPGYCF